ncbi:MAG: hypothetical protein SNJ84_09275 [Verrucomicrobiia bacterium]
MVGNLILPGVGTGLLAGGGRRGWWKPALVSLAGLGMSLVGAGVVVSLTGLVPTEEHLQEVFIEQPANLAWLALGAVLTLGGGLLVLAGYGWSLGKTVIRWKDEAG